MNELIDELEKNKHGHGWLWFLGIFNTAATAGSYIALQAQVATLQGQVAILAKSITALEGADQLETLGDLQKMSEGSFWNKLGKWFDDLWGSIKQLGSGYDRLADFSEAATDYVDLMSTDAPIIALSVPITFANSFGNDIPITFANSFGNDINSIFNNNIQTLNTDLHTSPKDFTNWLQNLYPVMKEMSNNIKQKYIAAGKMMIHEKHRAKQFIYMLIGELTKKVSENHFHEEYLKAQDKIENRSSNYSNNGIILIKENYGTSMLQKE